MVVSNNVEAYLARYSDGEPYTEYAVPATARNYTASPNERYIEAVTDERFEINVALMPGVDFMKSPHSISRTGSTRETVTAPTKSRRTKDSAKIALQE